MAQVWEFHHLQWCYSIDDRVSNGVYVSREKAEAASRKPQHFSNHTFTTRPVHHWLRESRQWREVCLSSRSPAVAVGISARGPRRCPLSR